MRRYEGGKRSGDIFVRDRMTGPRWPKRRHWMVAAITCGLLIVLAAGMLLPALARAREEAHGATRSARRRWEQRRAALHTKETMP